MDESLGRSENEVWTKAGQEKENMTVPRLKNSFLLFFSDFSRHFLISVVTTSNLSWYNFRLLGWIIFRNFLDQHLDNIRPSQ